MDILIENIDLLMILTSYLDPYLLVPIVLSNKRYFDSFNQSNVLKELCVQVKIRRIDTIQSFRDLNVLYKALYYNRKSNFTINQLLDIIIEEDNCESFSEVNKIFGNLGVLREPEIKRLFVKICLCESYKLMKEFLNECFCGHRDQHEHLERLSTDIIDHIIGIKDDINSKIEDHVCPNIIAYAIIRNNLRLDPFYDLNNVKNLDMKTNIRLVYVNIASFEDLYPDHSLMSISVKFAKVYKEIASILY
jgi:hypothetical protein